MTAPDTGKLAELVALARSGMTTEYAQSLIRVAYWHGELAGYRQCVDDIIARMDKRETP